MRTYSSHKNRETIHCITKRVLRTVLSTSAYYQIQNYALPIGTNFVRLKGCAASLFSKNSSLRDSSKDRRVRKSGDNMSIIALRRCLKMKSRSLNPTNILWRELINRSNGTCSKPYHKPDRLLSAPKITNAKKSKHVWMASMYALDGRISFW